MSKQHSVNPQNLLNSKSYKEDLLLFSKILGLPPEYADVDQEFFKNNWSAVMATYEQLSEQCSTNNLDGNNPADQMKILQNSFKLAANVRSKMQPKHAPDPNFEKNIELTSTKEGNIIAKEKVEDALYNSTEPFESKVSGESKDEESYDCKTE